MVDAAVIGGGPAGIAAAVQLSRYGLQTLLFEEQLLGGLIKNANLLENYPGFPGGITGRQMVHRLSTQIKNHPVQICYEKVKQVFPPEDEQERFFTLSTGDNEYRSRVVVAASGTLPKTTPLVENLPGSLKEKVFYEVFHLLEEKKKNIAIMGAGDAAFDYALNLARENRVTILNRGNRVKALPLLVERVNKNQAIQYRDNSPVTAIEKGRTHALSLALAGDKTKEILEFDYLIAALGREERRDYFSPQLLAREKELMQDGALHLVGDLKNGIYRQVSLAVGDGVKAAMKIYEMIGDCT